MNDAAALRGAITRLAIIMIIVVSIGGPAATLAAAQDESVPAVEPSPTVTVPTVAPTIAPTPTPIPTIPPTPTLVPTDVPSPTPTPTEEVPATVTSPATEETPPTPTATASPTPTPAVTPTPAPAPDTLECTDPAAIQDGSIWRFESTCVYSANSPRPETRIEAAVSAADESGWSVQLRPTGAASSWTAAGTTSILIDAQRQAGATITFEIQAIAPMKARAGQQATLTVSSRIVDPQQVTDGPSITLGAAIPNTASRQPEGTTSVAPQSQPAVLSCTQPNRDQVQPGRTLTYQCQFSVTYLNPGKVVTTFTSSISSGWDIGLTSDFGGNGAPASPMNGDGAAQIQVTSQGGSLTGTITVSVKAPETAIVGSQGTMTLASDCDRSQACPGAGQKGSVTIATTVIAAPLCQATGDTPVIASLAGGSLPAVPFAYTARTNTGTMTMTVQNPTQCSGWNVDISATDLTYSGAAPGQPIIPASNLRVSGAGVSTVHLATTSQRLISNGGTDSAYTYPLTITLDIPAGAPAGIYTSTITITTTSAP